MIDDLICCKQVKYSTRTKNSIVIDYYPGPKIRRRIRSDPKTDKNPIGMRVIEFRSDPTIGYSYVSDNFRLLKSPFIPTVGFRLDFYRIPSIFESVVDLIYYDNVWNLNFTVGVPEGSYEVSQSWREPK